MFADRENLVDELRSAMEGDLPCIKESVFLQFLDAELERAERYGSFVSLVMFRLQERNGSSRFVSNGNGKAANGDLKRLASFLKSRLRRSDYLAYLQEQTLGVLLLNSKEEHTSAILGRLREDSALFLKAHRKDLEIQAGASVFPTEANSRETLLGAAISRLEDAY